MDTFLLAGFPFLYLPLSLSCCCAFYSSPTSAIGPGDIRLWAEGFCSGFLAGVEQGKFMEEGSKGVNILGNSVTCGSKTIASVVISTPEDCVSVLERGVSSRLSFSVLNKEVVAVPVTINEGVHKFYAVRYNDHSYWGERFCSLNGIGGDECVRAVVGEAQRLFQVVENVGSGGGEEEKEEGGVGGLTRYEPNVKVKLHHFEDYNGTMVREWKLVTEGVEKHPWVEEVDEAPDVSICMIPGKLKEQASEALWWCPPLGWVQERGGRSIVVVLDMTDRPTLPFAMETYEKNGLDVHYFKRSYVLRSSGVSSRPPDVSYRGKFHPLPLGVLDDYFAGNTRWEDRQFFVSCSIRPSSTSRVWALDVMTRITKGLAAERVFMGQVNDNSRDSVSDAYFTLLSESQVIVTVNPPSWEGDHRLWEALTSGALVVVDKASGWDNGFGLVDGWNCAFYDMWDEGSLRDVMREYIFGGEEGMRKAKEIGERGKIWAKGQRGAQRIGYILDKVGIV